MRGLVHRCGACPYLPEQEFHAFHPLDEAVGDGERIPYRRLMDHRFRRSGAHLYMPMCPGCDACQPVRVACAAFVPRADQRRCAARNRDLAVTFHPRGLDDERLALYRRYQREVHAKDDADDPHPFLVEDGGVAGGELHARDGAGGLVAVSIVDTFADALSSVYCYYDSADRRRALGTFMVLAEIDHCRAHGLSWLYLGFLVRGCAKMAYKARYLPQEVLEAGRWVRYGDGIPVGGL